MATPQNTKKGTHSGRITRPEPQSDWDSFPLRKGIPKEEREISPSPAGTTTSHRTQTWKRINYEGRKDKKSFVSSAADTSKKR
jgi:hypothetical protein